MQATTNSNDDRRNEHAQRRNGERPGTEQRKAREDRGGADRHLRAEQPNVGQSRGVVRCGIDSAPPAGYRWDIPRGSLRDRLRGRCLVADRRT